MMNNFLDKIINHKRKYNEQKKPIFEKIKDKIGSIDYNRYRLFHRQISNPGQINLIAEIKKASPSKGLICEEFDLLSIAKIYDEQNATAISILTEDKYFLGKPSYIIKVSEVVDLPILMKDFFINEGQIYEARYYGASAILLIAAVLKPNELKALLDLATKMDLDCLVEVHDQEELKIALDCGADIIGVNNRNLKTFEVNMKTCLELIPQIPKDHVIVAESGIQTHDHVLQLKEAGANAVLIGETFMKESDIGSKMKEVMYG